MGETMTTQASEGLGKFAAAMAKAQGDMGSALKSSRNPHFKSMFADLASVVDAVRGPCLPTVSPLCRCPPQTATRSASRHA